MRLENVKVPDNCPECKSHLKVTVAPVTIKVLGIMAPSQVQGGVCECGAITHLTPLSLSFVYAMLKRNGVLKDLKGGYDQIIKEANFYRKKNG